MDEASEKLRTKNETFAGSYLNITLFLHIPTKTPAKTNSKTNNFFVLSPFLIRRSRINPPKYCQK